MSRTVVLAKQTTKEEELTCPSQEEDSGKKCTGTLRRLELISICRRCNLQFNNKDLEVA